jgi:hypothetical protein
LDNVGKICDEPLFSPHSDRKDLCAEFSYQALRPSFSTPRWRAARAIGNALADGRAGKDERVVLFNCGSGLKSEMPKVTRRLDRFGEIDYASL